MPNFHNPYNFIPLGDESNLKHRGAPRGHHRLHEDLYTGTIDVKLTTVTPLLIVDPETMTENAGHKTFAGVVKNPITPGLPDIPITSLRGMLRAAYEAITESRLGVWSKSHTIRLGHRLTTEGGKRAIPARIEPNGTDITVFLGMHENTMNLNSVLYGDFRYQGIRNLQCAAWVFAYQRNGQQTPFQTMNLQHGQEVSFTFQQYKKFRGDNAVFDYLRVTNLNTSTVQVQPGSPQGPNHRSENNGLRGSKTGVLVVTGKNMDNKHDERIFFGPRLLKGIVRQEHLDQYRDLITNYQVEHEDEVKSGSFAPPALNRSRFSRHILKPSATQHTDKSQRQSMDEREPRGKYVYALFDANGNLESIFPVMISRGVFDLSPNDCVPDCFRPAKALPEASPADRLFGFVNPDGQGSYKGQIRISSVKNEGGRDARTLDPALTMAILGQPKASMGPFYLADANGQPVPRKSDSYGKNKDQRIRGRKVYLVHKADKVTWDFNGQAEREYKATKDVGASTQNKTINEWLDPGAVFSFRIHATNCTESEIAALLWLLDLSKQEEGACLTLGGGKSFGFGAVKVKIDHALIQKGNAWSSSFAELSATPLPLDHADLINRLQIGPDIKEAFLSAAKGFDTATTPIRYPRVEPFHDSRGNHVTKRGDLNFEWYKKNKDGTGYLPLLKADMKALTSNGAPQIASGGQGGGQAPDSRHGTGGQAGGGGNRGGGQNYWKQDRGGSQNRGGGGGGGYKGDQNRRSGPPPSQGRRREPGS